VSAGAPTKDQALAAFRRAWLDGGEGRDDQELLAAFDAWWRAESNATTPREWRAERPRVPRD
jgi:hypothetical protein